MDLYRQAIALSADPAGRRLELLPELAEALVSAGLLAEGEQACREALQRRIGPDRAARLRLPLVKLLTRRARTAEAIAEGEAGLATDGIGERERARLTAWVAMSRVFEGDIEPAVQEARSVLETSDDAPARALATNALAIAAEVAGRFTDAVELIAPTADWADEARSDEARRRATAHDPGAAAGTPGSARRGGGEPSSAAAAAQRRSGIADAVPVYPLPGGARGPAARAARRRLGGARDAHAELAEQTGHRLARRR